MITFAFSDVKSGINNKPVLGGWLVVKLDRVQSRLYAYVRISVGQDKAIQSG